MELFIAAQQVEKQLKNEYKLNIRRLIVGEFMTALDMPGFSISLILLHDHEILELLDHPTNAIAWPKTIKDRKHSAVVHVNSSSSTSNEKTLQESSTCYQLIKLISELFIKKSQMLTELDRAAGDGDMGISMERGARAVLQRLPTFPDNLQEAIRSLSLCLQQHTGGFGVFYFCLYFDLI